MCIRDSCQSLVELDVLRSELSIGGLKAGFGNLESIRFCGHSLHLLERSLIVRNDSLAVENLNVFPSEQFIEVFIRDFYRHYADHVRRRWLTYREGMYQ